MITVYIFSIAIAILVSSSGAWIDGKILRNGKKISPTMKILGNSAEFAVMAVVLYLIRGEVQGVKLLLLFLDMGLVWWIIHDMMIGKILTGSIWHLGTTGFDKFIRKIALDSGAVYFGYKMVNLIIFSGWYFGW